MRFIHGVLATLLVVALATPASAEIAPEHYVDMQQTAPEAVHIEVVDVDVEWCLFFCEKREVVVAAKVISVERTTAGLKVGDALRIKYVHLDPSSGWVGPRPIPILGKGQTVAYLAKTEAGHFKPAARGASFQVLGLPAGSRPVPSGSWDDGFYQTEDSPDPLACQVDNDCIGDTTLGKDGCCNEPTTIKAYSKKYHRWAGAWRSGPACKDARCPAPPNPAQPAECYFQVSCVDNACVNACGE